jgi:hypothetical protein
MFWSSMDKRGRILLEASGAKKGNSSQHINVSMENSHEYFARMCGLHRAEENSRPRALDLHFPLGTVNRFVR